MSPWLRAIAYVFITLFLGVVLRELGFKGSRLVILVGTVSVLGAAVIYLGETVSSLSGIADKGDEYTVAMLKMVGVGYAFGISSDICRDLGETSLAGAVCIFGRVEILMISLPFIREIVERGIELL